MSNPEVFRPRSNFVYAGLIYILCAGMVVSGIVISGLGGAIPTILWSGVIAIGAYLLFIKPKVIICDEGIVITNPIHEFKIGWRDIDAIEAKYTMFLMVGTRKIHAWAAPAPGRYHSRTIHSSELKGLHVSNPENMRPGESPRTHSGVATHLARLRHAASQKGIVANLEFKETFDRRTVIAVTALTTAALLSLAF